MSIITPEDDKAFDAYEKPMFGFHGQFQTKKSWPLSFFQTSIPIEQIDILKTAGEALEPGHFKELIQRDIDEDRVKKIVEEYLEKKNTVLFFPPLIASVIAHDNNKTVPVYEEFEPKFLENDKGEVVAVTIEPGERFKVSLPTTNSDTGYQYEGKNIRPYWSNFQVKKNKIHLVVIDGQHRLSALKKLKDKDPDACANLDIPVCIVYSPGAYEGNEKKETITWDVRELFTRINNTGKQVSGHFLTLLKDGDLSAIAVREICEHAKQSSLTEDVTLLHLIEWNIRDHKRSSQLNKNYSLTSVGILTPVLNRYGLSLKDGVPITLLKLKSKESLVSKLEPDFNIDQINSDNPDIPLSLLETLEDLALHQIAPSIEVLFTKPKPYSQIKDAFLSAMAQLDKDIADDKYGSKRFKNILINDFRDTNSFDDETVQGAEKRFLGNVNKFLERDDLSIYQYSVFQQGYIRAWIELCKKLSNYGIENKDIAVIYTKAANESIFDKDIDIFSVKDYTDLTLYRNQKLLQTIAAKNLWTYLILSCLLNPSSQKSLKKSLSKFLKTSEAVDEAMELLKGVFEDALERFSTQRKNLHRSFYSENWKLMSDVIDAENFEKLLALESKTDDESAAEQESILEKLADKKYIHIKTKLRSAIGIA